MSGVLRTIGQVAGVAATISAIALGPTNPITIGLTAVATVASIAAQLTAKKPRMQGSASGITIGATMAALCIIGESYCGGARVKQVGYGEASDVPNAYAWVVDVYSVAGPLEALVSRQIDFKTVAFSGTAALGYYDGGLYSDYQLGATPEASALSPQWNTPPGWGANSKLSGKAAIGWNAKWPKNGKMFGSGFPQTGAVWRGIKLWDPRDDSTYPGGSGPSRWADPVFDAVGHEAAKATWAYSRNGGLHGLRYALGSWERDETGSGPYIKVFGVGLKPDQIVIEDFVELANICDINGWTVNGVLREGLGISKWDNLKRILGACAAEPVWKGGRLGVKVNAPRIALDTITMEDIAEGEPVVPGTRAYEDRKNTLIPKFVDPASKWELVPSDAVTRSAYVAEDGEERSEEWTLDLVTDADQAAQVTGYELVNRREQGPITLPLKPRLRTYPPGTLLNIDEEVQATFGIRASQVLVASKVTDVGQLSWQFNLVTESEDKHDFALGLAGAVPPPPYIPSGEVRDESGSYTTALPIIPVADEAEMLALDVPVGTMVYREDTGETWFYNGGTSGTVADWTLISTTADGAAEDVTFTPAGTIAATDVQGAIEELDGDLGDLADDIADEFATRSDILFQSAVSVSHTGNTTETTLRTVTIPAGAIGPNGRCRIITMWSYTNNANTKTPRIKLDGNNLFQVNVTTTSSLRQFTEFSNVNAQNSQKMLAVNSSGGFGTVASAAIGTLAVDTSVAKDITFTAQLANAADTITLESVSVEILPGA